MPPIVGCALNDHAKGLLITTLGVLIITPDALLLRIVSAEPWTILVYRGLGFFLVLSLITLIRHGRGWARALRTTGKEGVITAILLAAGQCLFVLSISNTTAANTLVIIAATPLLAAFLARVVLGEPVSRRTIIASGVALIAVALTMGSSILAQDEGAQSHISGDLAAVMVTIVLAVTFTLLRLVRQRDMMPAVATSGLVTCLVALFVADTIAVASADIVPLAILVLFVSPISFALITTGPRYVPAPEVSLLMLLETALGPLWVWLVINETPGVPTLIGGTILIATLIVNAIAGLREHSVANA